MKAQQLKTHAAQCAAWVGREEHRQKAREIRAELGRVFCEHPQATGETYWQHLWFTVKMATRFIYTTSVLLIHGLFPFLLTKAASNQIEAVYKIMRSRVPKARRDEIDLDYQV